MVIRATSGVSGQRRRSSRSTLAVVDLPTATEPATPITKGVLAVVSPRKVFVAAWSCPAAAV